MQIKSGQIIAISLEPKDNYGNHAILDGFPIWTVTNSDLIELEVNTANGLFATAKSLGPVGSATIVVEVDADLSEGSRFLYGYVEVDILPGEATDLGVFVEPVTVNVVPRVEAAILDVSTSIVEDFVEEAVTEEAILELSSGIVEEAVTEEQAI